MSDFLLGVHFDGDDELSSSSVTEFSKAMSQAIESQDQLLVVEADSIAFYMSQQKVDIDDPVAVAILVPSSMMESLLIETKSELESTACGTIQKLCHDGVQQKTLALIHPMLEREPCRIRMHIRSKSKAPSDVLLLDVSNCGEGWLEEMKRRLCGEPMQCCESAVIELFAISRTITQKQDQHDNVASLNGPLYEIPTCAVCLHRIYPPRLGMPKPRNDQLCSEYCVSGICRNQAFLQPWTSNSCQACHMIQSNELEDVFCNCCALQETLWICLTCGFVGCGRYSHGHAANHFTESQHAFSLEMATLRIWDYASGEFAHRGDFLECPTTNRRHNHNHHHNLSQWNVALPWEHEKKPTTSPTAASWDDPSPKKATMIGEEYEALLQSALVDQAQHYEGEMSRLHAQFTSEQIDEDSMTPEEKAEIDNLKSGIRQLRDELNIMGRNLLDMQAQEAGHRAASQRLLREQGIAKDLLDKIREEAEKEHQQGKSVVEDLEQQVADLTANLRMRHQISQDEELSQAQIYGTVTTNTKQVGGKRNGGKKSRRSNRK
ncbi:Ubiquitin Carboxyl-terminal Hydrolase-like zinc finger [Fragilaria crotonensis]|nr:Ubiquitin Carboxyl-terminal Hydrolase-like zinc finger [Fragilaria crotonensis]